MEYLGGVLPADGHRKFAGIKYHRITGRTPYKEFYVPGWAHGAPDHHAGDFVSNRVKQFSHLLDVTNIDPIILTPFDAELFRHWWSYDHIFFNYVIRTTVYDQNDFQLPTPSPSSETH